MGCLTTLDNPENMEISKRCFEALARVKKLRDRRSEGEQNDIFLTTAGCEAIQKVSAMTYPRNLEELNFKKIGGIIKRNIRLKKRLVITERTKFQEKKTAPR